MGKNGLIVKNTIMLYIRMLICTAVALYTSRIVLNTLGASDFGIYNVVGGVVVLFSFLNTSLANAGQRYLSVAIGEGKDIQKVFSSLLVTHLFVASLVVILAETIGLWLLYNTLEIPEGRFQSALWVYQISILNTCVGIIRVPYNSSIIANEKMGFYAYVSILESILKLTIVFLLIVSNFDKLICYALLQLLVSVVILLVYVFYANRISNANRFILKRDIKIFKDIFIFTGWNFLGTFADMSTRQGVTIILNYFFGVLLNAAYGIFITVRTTIYSFVSSVQVAANPQIIKSYASKELDRFYNLIYYISKCSFFLMLLLAIPVCINIDFVLRLWLINPPEYTSTLLIWGMVFSLVDVLHGPLWVSIQATGNIRNYQIVTSLVLLLILPVSFIALKMGMGPEWIVISQIVIGVVVLVIRIRYTHVYTALEYKDYLINVLLPVVLVTLICVPLSLLTVYIPYNSEWVKLIVTTMLSIGIVGGVSLALGLNRVERKKVITMIKTRLNVKH